MGRVSKRITNFAAIAAVILAIVVQPVFAAAKKPEKCSCFDSLVRKIIRVLDTIQIGLPPG